MKNEILYYCDRCANEVAYTLKAVERCLEQFGIILCRVCTRKNKNGNLPDVSY